MPTASPAPVRSETNNGRTTQATQLTDSVITADVLAEKVAVGSRIVVGARAIVTPSARDWLRHNNVELIHGASATGATSSVENQSDRLVITHSVSQTIDRVLDDAGRPANGGWNRKSVGSADEAANKAIGELRREVARLIVVLTDEPEVVACLTNRNEKVKAAVVADAAAVARVKTGLNGNVFVIDPTGRSFFELRNILRRVES